MISNTVQIYWLRDKSATLVVDDVQLSSAWQPLLNEINLGFTGDALWLRIKAAQPAENSLARLLEINNTLLEDIRLYEKAAGGEWQEQRAGRSILHSEWPLNTRVPTFRIDWPHQPHELLLRIHTQNSLSTGIRLWPEELYNIHSRNEAMFYGLYFGFFILVLVFQLFFWLTTHEPINGWYLPYALFLFVAALMLSGYPANVLDWPTGFATPFLGIVLCISIAFSSKFTSVLLDLPVVMPRLNRIFLTIFIGLSMMTAASVLFGHYAAGVQAAQLSTLVLITVSLCLVIYLIRQGHASARFYLLAFGILDTGIVIRYLRNLGFLAPGPLTDYSYYIGTVLHLTLISLYIIYRYNALKRALTIEQLARQEQREFMGMVSHEFRTPLAIIITTVQQLTGNPNAPQEKTLKRYENIKNASRRMTDLMDSYLSAERMDTTQQPLQVQVCDPHQLLCEIIVEWPEDRVRLTTTSLPAEYLCDPELIQVALRNLLVNADRHAPKESVIDLNATGDENGGMRITVEDHGPGIPDDEISKLFQRYFRGRAARGTPGAGLGLFLVKRIAKAHRGQVSVVSIPGKTSFEILLPP